MVSMPPTLYLCSFVRSGRSSSDSEINHGTSYSQRDIINHHASKSFIRICISMHSGTCLFCISAFLWAPTEIYWRNLRHMRKTTEAIINQWIAGQPSNIWAHNKTATRSWLQKYKWSQLKAEEIHSWNEDSRILALLYSDYYSKRKPRQQITGWKSKEPCIYWWLSNPQL